MSNKPHLITPQEFIEGAYTALIAQGICKVYGGELPITWEVDNVLFYGGDSFQVAYKSDSSQHDQTRIFAPINCDWKMRVEWFANESPVYTLTAQEFYDKQLNRLAGVGICKAYLDSSCTQRIGFLAEDRISRRYITKVNYQAEPVMLNDKQSVYLALDQAVTAAMFRVCDYHLWIARGLCDVLYTQSESDFAGAQVIRIENTGLHNGHKSLLPNGVVLIVSDDSVIDVPGNTVLNVVWHFPVIAPSRPDAIEATLNALPDNVIKKATLQELFDTAWKAGLRPTGYTRQIRTIPPPPAGAPMPPPADLEDLATAAAALLQTSDDDNRPVIPLLSGFIHDILARAYPGVKTAENLRALDTVLKQITASQ